jgi:hypothetical protein
MIEMKEVYRVEVLDMLDKLIDSRPKMPTFNDLAMQLSERIEKVRNQEKIMLKGSQLMLQQQQQDEGHSTMNNF